MQAGLWSLDLHCRYRSTPNLPGVESQRFRNELEAVVEPSQPSTSSIAAANEFGAKLVAGAAGDLVQTRYELVAENALLRQQLIGHCQTKSA